MFNRTAYQLKNGSRRTVVPTREIAEALASTPDWKYARITTVKVSWFRPGFGQVETFAARVPRAAKVVNTPASSADESPQGGSQGATVAPKAKRGRPTNAERAARIAASNAEESRTRGIAPANITESSVSSDAPSTTTV